MVELYSFEVEGTTHRFTPELEAVVYSASTFNPKAIKRGSLTLTSNFAKSLLSFTYPRTDAFARQLINYFPETPTPVKIYRNGTLFWQGRVIDIIGTTSEIEVRCDSIYTTLRNAGMPKRITTQCRHILYSEDCGLVKESWMTAYSVTGINSSSFTVSGLAGTPSYSGGIAAINGQTRGILVHSGSVIQINHNFSGIQTGTLTLFRGCALTKIDCMNFANFDNYGGFEYLPLRSPISNLKSIL